MGIESSLKFRTTQGLVKASLTKRAKGSPVQSNLTLDKTMHGFPCVAVCDVVTTIITITITITITAHLLCDRLQLVPKDVHHHVKGVEGEPGGEEDDADCNQQQICSTSPCQFSCKPKQQQKIEEMKKKNISSETKSKR